jgi:ankyrin repeat protein
VLQLLLENGAEVDEVCDDGQTALEHATSNIEMVFLTENTGEVENILIKHGAK